MKTNILRVGVIGAGVIAGKIASTLKDLERVANFAVASRSLEKAEKFAAQWGFERAYGSYAELLDDPDVDLAYIATPHSHHFEVTREAILKGKPCLVEKAFMANYRQSKEIIDLARERKVFIAEAIWTRYQPALKMIKDLLAANRIGKPQFITASIGYPMLHKERILRADLCGGALLDVGVYAINFVRMFCDANIERVLSQCTKSDTGMDLQNTASFVFENGMMANIQSSATVVGDNQGIIWGTEACLAVDDINNPQVISIYGRNHVLQEEIRVPAQITGYEYEFLACKEALANNLTESPYMPLDETLTIMQIMDDLRKEWGVVYPMDE